MNELEMQEELRQAGVRAAQRRHHERGARAEREARAVKVIEALAAVGIDATYEERDTPLVSMHLEAAELLLSALEDLRVEAEFYRRT